MFIQEIIRIGLIQILLEEATDLAKTILEGDLNADSSKKDAAHIVKLINEVLSYVRMDEVKIILLETPQSDVAIELQGIFIEAFVNGEVV